MQRFCYRRGRNHKKHKRHKKRRSLLVPFVLLVVPSLYLYGAIPSVISILVPHGSAINATRMLLTKLLGVSP